MATPSPLKAASALPPEFFGGEDTDYAEKYQNARDAEQKLMDMLAKRNESRLSPSMLSLAGELLDPGRTGSFGEALGRGAKSYAAAQGAETKELAENAMMQMQLRNMQLERAQANKMANMAGPMIRDFLSPGAPEAAASSPQAVAPPAKKELPKIATDATSLAALQGKLPPEEMPATGQDGTQVPPVAQPMPVAKPTVLAPQGATIPPVAEGAPTLMINNRPVNPKIIAGLQMVPATKAMGDALEKAYNMQIKDRELQFKASEDARAAEKLKIDQAIETRNQAKEKRDVTEFERGAFKTTPWGYIDQTDPKKPVPVYVPNPGEPDLEIRFPEFNGEQLMGSRADLLRLREARENKDREGVEAIYNFLKFGVQGTPKDKAENAGQMSVSEKKIDVEGKTASVKKTAEIEAQETADFLKNEGTNRDTIFTAARIIKNASENAGMYGLLKKPGIGTALMQFARDQGEQGTFAFTKDNVENALRLANVNTKDMDMVKVAEMSSDLARLHFGFRKSLLEKQGQVSDMEDRGIRKIQGTISEPAQYLIGMAQLTGRKAQYDTELAAGLRKYRRDNKGATLEDFRSDPKSGYNKILSTYENWIMKTYKLPKGLTPQTDTKPANKGAAALSNENLDAILKKRGITK